MLTRQTFSCLKSTIETLGKVNKKDNKKGTRMTSLNFLILVRFFIRQPLLLDFNLIVLHLLKAPIDKKNKAMGLPVSFIA